MLNIRDDWKKWLKENNIIYLNSYDEFSKIYNKKCIICSRCSKTKSGKSQATPKEFYVSNLNNNFYYTMEKNNYYYAILSDKYGIHFADELVDYYDIHPSTLTNEEKKKLGNIIKRKCDAKNIDTLIFYNTSPLLSLPYFEMLINSGLKIYFVTKLENFNKKKYFKNLFEI